MTVFKHGDIRSEDRIVGQFLGYRLVPRIAVPIRSRAPCWTLFPPLRCVATIADRGARALAGASAELSAAPSNAGLVRERNVIHVDRIFELEFPVPAKHVLVDAGAQID